MSKSKLIWEMPVLKKYLIFNLGIQKCSLTLGNNSANTNCLLNLGCIWGVILLGCIYWGVKGQYIQSQPNHYYEDDVRVTIGV